MPSKAQIRSQMRTAQRKAERQINQAVKSAERKAQTEMNRELKKLERDTNRKLRATRPTVTYTTTDRTIARLRRPSDERDLLLDVRRHLKVTAASTV